MPSTPAPDRPTLAAVERGFVDDVRAGVRTPTGGASSFMPPPSGTIEERWAIYAGGALVDEGLFIKEDEPCRFRSRDVC